MGDSAQRVSAEGEDFEPRAKATRRTPDRLRTLAPRSWRRGLFRAARFGVHGRLPDAEGMLRPVSDLLDDALERAQPWAGELGCSDALAGLRDLTARAVAVRGKNGSAEPQP